MVKSLTIAKWVQMRSGLLVAVALPLAFAANVAKATIILPSQSLPTTGAGTYGVAMVYDTMPLPFVSSSSLFSGYLDAQVWQEAGGTLDFVYQLYNNPGSGDALKRITFTDFSGLITNVDDTLVGFAPPPLGSFGTVAPVTMDRSAGVGGTVGFSFANGNPVNPGAFTYTMVVDTNATAFSIGGGLASISDGDIAYVPVPTPLPVPEPATLGLVAFGLSMLALRPGRNRKAC